MTFPFIVESCYPASGSCWLGRRIQNAQEFEAFLKGKVKARVTDSEFQNDFEQDLEALATTQMATSTLTDILNESAPLLDWEIGEGIAECLLQSELGALWPWNENRDRKTPRASLPGADLVGIADEQGVPTLLFGEVKTSSENKKPPGVMSGRGGLAHQIDDLVDSPNIHRSLLQWLYARCRGTPHWDKFQAACANYLASGGKRLLLAGILIRDTDPHEDDLRTRGEKFAARVDPAPKIRLDAWYTPRKIEEWPKMIQESQP